MANKPDEACIEALLIANHFKNQLIIWVMFQEKNTHFKLSVSSFLNVNI